MSEDRPIGPGAGEPRQPDGQHNVTPLPPLPWPDASGGSQPSGPAPSPQERYPGVQPPPRARTIWWLFVVGFIAAMVLEPLAAYVMSAIGAGLDRVPLAVPFVGMAGFLGPLVLYLVLFLEGRRRLNDRLMSFGKGALFGYFVPFVILPLLLFGVCFFSGFPK